MRTRPPVRRLADLTAYVLDLGPAGVLLTSPQAVADVLEALEGSIRRQRRDGVPIPDEVAAFVDMLRRRLRDGLTAGPGFRGRQSSAAIEPPPAGWEPPVGPVTVAEASEVLDLGPRQVRNLIHAAGCRR